MTRALQWLVRGWTWQATVWMAAVAFALASAAVWKHRYDEEQRKRGRLEVWSLQAKAREDSLVNLLQLEERRTARVDTLREIAVQHFTKTVTQWKTDTIRLSVLSLPDSSLVPVREYRRLSSALDSVTEASEHAIAMTDSVAKQERREKLLWKARAENWQQKAERQVPTIVMRPDKWQHRGEGFLGGLLASGLAFALTR